MYVFYTVATEFRSKVVGDDKQYIQRRAGPLGLRRREAERLDDGAKQGKANNSVHFRDLFPTGILLEILVQGQLL